MYRLQRCRQEGFHELMWPHIAQSAVAVWKHQLNYSGHFQSSPCITFGLWKILVKGFIIVDCGTEDVKRDILCLYWINTCVKTEYKWLYILNSVHLVFGTYMLIVLAWEKPTYWCFTWSNYCYSSETRF